LRTKSTAATLVLALLSTTPAFAEGGTSPIIGAWRMTSLEAGTEGNLKPVPYSGQVIFSEGGTLSVQAMNPDANAPETPYTANGYEAYYGPVTVNDQDKIFTITVESSLVRNLIGQSMKRRFEVSGNTLTLTPDDRAEGWRVTYERL
jgi:hypothetical protein